MVSALREVNIWKYRAKSRPSRLLPRGGNVLSLMRRRHKSVSTLKCDAAKRVVSATLQYVEGDVAAGKMGRSPYIHISSHALMFVESET
eukprot:6184981-Pleurochrysis_carterae.AAC.2